ncbi:MAG: hypothetical protein ACKO1O_15270 [Erythrobacter sp.]
MGEFGTFFAGELSRLERCCLRSFVRHGHGIALYAYDPVGAVPDGVELRDAASVLPREAFFPAGNGPHEGTVAAFTDMFRYAMIIKTGLIWTDTDVVCLKPDWPDWPLAAAFQDAIIVNGAVLGGSAAGPLLERAAAIAGRVGTIGPWAYTGPHLLTALVHDMGLTRHVLPRETFYPFSYRDAASTLLTPRPGIERVQWPEPTVAVHLWNETLRLAGHDRETPPPDQSLLKLILADLGD